MWRPGSHPDAAGCCCKAETGSREEVDCGAGNSLHVDVEDFVFAVCGSFGLFTPNLDLHSTSTCTRQHAAFHVLAMLVHSLRLPPGWAPSPAHLNWMNPPLGWGPSQRGGSCTMMTTARTLQVPNVNGSWDLRTSMKEWKVQISQDCWIEEPFSDLMPHSKGSPMSNSMNTCTSSQHCLPVNLTVFSANMNLSEGIDFINTTTLTTVVKEHSDPAVNCIRSDEPVTIPAYLLARVMTSNRPPRCGCGPW